METFEEVILNNDNLLRGIYSYGWVKPSAIQRKAIPELLSERDLLAQAQSGTGKTGAFCIPALYKIDFSIKKPQVLIISHTHELAQQTYEVILNLGSYLFNSSKTACSLLIGGMPVFNDIDKLKNEETGIVIVIGTPGRIFDILKRQVIDLSAFKLCIIDEADELLSKGFMTQVQDILKLLPKESQKALFSATMPPEIIQATKDIMVEPNKILERVESIPLAGIKQFKLDVQDEFKVETIIELYSSISINQSIIFTNEKKKAIWISQILQNKDFSTICLHSDLERGERDSLMREFKDGKHRVMIATDLVARGIDIQHVSIVINYDLPLKNESYIHRIGRCGRYGRRGIAINMINKKDSIRLKEIEKHYGIEIDFLTIDFRKYLQ